MRRAHATLLSLCLPWTALACGETSAEPGAGDGGGAAATRAVPSAPSQRYLDTSLSVEMRVRDLLDQMTAEEKLQQLLALSHQPIDDMLREERGGSAVEPMVELLEQMPSGVLAGALKRLPLEQGIELVQSLQARARELSRFGIPLLVIEECLHGLVARGSTSYPVPLAMASTFDTELVERVAVAIGVEARARGVGQALSPTLNLARDPRAGRTEETFGEDPYLASRMAVAYVRGLQSQGVAATLKHFVANFAADGGRDSQAVHVSERLLREIYFPPFEAAIREGGAMCVMAAYNSLDGVPCHANPWLLTDVLKREWGLPGFVVGDFTGVVGLLWRHAIAADQSEAGLAALDAGLDVDLPTSQAFRRLDASDVVDRLGDDVLDEAARRVLTVKMELGLFERPPADLAAAAAVVDSDEHRGLAREVARRSLVLLKNEERALPLPRDLPTLAVIGPLAAEGQLGGYSAPGVTVVSPLDGVRAAVSDRTEVRFVEGCAVSHFTDADQDSPLRPMMIRGPDDRAGLPEAVEVASGADAVLLFVGNLPGTEGEGADRSDLGLPGAQAELVRAVCAANDRVVVVLIHGGVITMEGWVDEVEAVVEAFYPGEEGGHAVAEVLFGDVNPSGRLPLTIPHRAGQLPLSYNARPGGRAIDDYVDLRGAQALFPFGHGLSYTDFRYRSLDVETQGPSGGPVRVRCDVQNVGAVAGVEVVQLYLHQRLGRVAPRRRELRRFQRVALEPGETQTVEFVLDDEDFAVLDARLERVPGRGMYDVLVGASSEDIRLRGEVSR